MTCKNCGSELNGSTLCSQCGFNNIPMSDNTVNIEQVNENITPPSLDISDVNMNNGVQQDINNANISTYEEEPVEEKKAQNNYQKPVRDDLDFSIPTVVEPTLNNDTNDGDLTQISGEQLVELSGKEKIKKRKMKFRSSSSIPKPILIVGVIVLLAIGIAIGSLAFSQNYCTYTKPTSDKKNNVVADGENNITQIGNYIYTIPKDYVYDRIDDGIIVYNKEDKWRVFISVKKGDYSALTASKTTIKTTLKAQSISINDIKELKVNERKVFLIESTMSTKNILMGYSSFDDSNVFYLELFDIDNNYNYDVLSAVTDILDNVKYSETISTMEKLEVYDYSEITIHAANEYKNKVG